MKCMLPAALALILLTAVGFAGEDPGRLDPKETSVVVVGVLRWKDPTVTTFPVGDRKDVELRDTLLALGVPEQRSALVLDEHATAARIRGTVAGIAKAATPGSTLIVYYAGHGSADYGESACLLPYDFAAGRAEQTGLFPAMLASAIKSGFRGGRVLLFADCCCSGVLSEAAEALQKAGFDAASVTSAKADGDSTSYWTYTRTLIAALAGDPIADRNGDGAITLGELDAEVSDAMKHRESQRSDRSFNGVGADFVLRSVDAKHPPRAKIEGPFGYREYVSVDDGGEKRSGRVVGFTKDGYEIELTGYSDRTVVRRTKDEIARVRFERLPVGRETGVTWKGLPFRAKVVGQDGDFHRITYVGWPPVWDEWVLSDRFCALPTDENPPPRVDWGPGQATGPPNSLVPGDHPTAWASATEDGSDEWLLLTYAQAVRPVAVLVYETYNPGALARVVGVGEDGKETELWSGKDPTPRADPIGISTVRTVKTKAAFKTLRLELASKSVPGWNEIDAVGLLDAEGTLHWAVRATASSTYSGEE